MKTIILYLTATVLFFAIDMLWLGLIARNFYKAKLGFIMSPNINWAAAIIFYLLYIAGILYFAVQPGLKEESLPLALLNGALLGFLCYITYDLTNMATIANWPIAIVIVDVLWGTFLTGTVAALTFFIYTRFFA
jgi:uncharacterized membrane protein